MRLSKCLCLRSWVTPGELRELALGLLLLVTCLSISLRNEQTRGAEMKVAIFGTGAMGSYVARELARTAPDIPLLMLYPGERIRSQSAIGDVGRTIEFLVQASVRIRRRWFWDGNLRVTVECSAGIKKSRVPRFGT